MSIPGKASEERQREGALDLLLQELGCDFWTTPFCSSEGLVPTLSCRLKTSHHQGTVPAPIRNMKVPWPTLLRFWKECKLLQLF